MRIKTIQTSNKNVILNVGMEKEQKQELGWRVSVLPIPAFHHCEPLCVACCDRFVTSLFGSVLRESVTS